VTVGETLAEARTKAGLSVDEISARTRIRQEVIREIEQDDFGACGGDVFVRGYVRVLADAVGLDAQPLIDEYEQSHAGGSSRFDVSAAAVPPVPETSHDLPAVDIADTRHDLPAIRLDDTVSDLDPVPAAGPTHPIPAAGPPRTAPTRALPSMPPRLQSPAPSGPPARRRTLASLASLADGGRRRTVGLAALAVVILAVVAVAGTLIVSNVSKGPGTNAPSAGRQALAADNPPGGKHAGAGGKTTANGAKSGTGTKSGTGSKQGKPVAQSAPASKATASAPRKKRPAAHRRAAPVKALAVSSAAAFGPGGTADGDNPQSAMYPVGSGASQPWQTDWYTTADFGRLKQGTGLLLDMGSAVTATTVRIDLGPYPGADLQLRAGNEPSLDSMHVKASANGAGGTVSLHLSSPARDRYLLVWFTLLPPNGRGQYQGSVYSVAVSGRA
jgi:hypothetical protein